MLLCFSSFQIKVKLKFPLSSSHEFVGVLGDVFGDIGAEDTEADDGNVDHIYTDMVCALFVDNDFGHVLLYEKFFFLMMTMMQPEM